MSPRFRLILLAFVALVLAGCSSSDEDRPFGQEAPSLTPVASAESYEVPQTIDKEYVERVIARLEEVRASVRRDVLASKQFTDENESQFNAIYGDPALSFQTGVFRDVAPVGDPRFKPNPAAAKYDVQQIVSFDSSCVWAKVQIDDSESLLNGVSRQRSDIVLKKRPHDEGINPTPWVMTQFAPESLQIVDDARACG